MGTYTVGSPEYAAACERAEEQIRDDLRAGAVEQYIDGESAQQYLGELIRLNSLPKASDENVNEWIERVSVNLDLYINRIISDAIESNVARVAQENQQ